MKVLEEALKVRKLRKPPVRADHNDDRSQQEAIVSAYINQLNAAVERDRAQRAELERANLKAVRERLTPLEDRLSRLLATIPFEIQREGLSLSSLQASLRGRWRGNCHPGELGTALRKLGFTRQRRWDDVSGFRALWYPTQ